MQFQQVLTLEYTKRKLARSSSLLDAGLDAGLSGPSRLHDLFVSFEAMTPGEYKRKAKGLTISYAFGGTPFGDCLLAMTQRGICHLGFVTEQIRSEAIDRLHAMWPGALFKEDTQAAQPVIANIFSSDTHRRQRSFHLHLKGTNFQVHVWKALLDVPEGWVVSYRDMAAYIGRPRAIRAVARAVAVNPVAFLIPCHRVIAQSGRIHNYRWGSSRKKALIGWEAARTGQVV